MNIYHKLDWNKCLSHEIWEAFKKGWPETDEESGQIKEEAKV